MSGRLEEMPGEEGYPAYLASRLAQFYERAGRVTVLGSDNREGSLSAIGAVSPPGGDISEPVSQATLRIVKVFWGLDASLAYKRHFPAINWLTSYSLYADSLASWFSENVSDNWNEYRSRFLHLLQEEAELEEIVRLVGMDALSASDRLKMEVARSIREDFLHQLAFHEVDTYSSLPKQDLMMKLILLFWDKASHALGLGADIEKIVSLPVRERIGRFKYISGNEINDEAMQIESRLAHEISEILEEED
jgi:V/A-type H+-transporting ATPase subunit A